MLDSYRQRFVHAFSRTISRRRSPTWQRLAGFYPEIDSPVLILRATQGLLAEDDILFPAGVAEKMPGEISHSRCVDVPGSNHYSIIFNARPDRDRTVWEFLAE